MCIPGLGKTQGLLLLLLLVIVSVAAAWYATSRDSASQRFDSCQITTDGSVALRYTYGVGDKVTASFVSRESVVVTLHIDRAPGLAPAIALFGELRFQSAGGSDRPFEYEDGTLLHCTEVRSLTPP